MAETLNGVRVVQVTMGEGGISVADVLAAWGADVICVEEASFDHEWERGAGARHIRVDLGHDDGYAVLLELVVGADVFLTDLAVATRCTLRIDLADLRAVNPNFVYVSCPAMGRFGEGGLAAAIAGAVAAALLNRERTRELQVVDASAVLQPVTEGGRSPAGRGPSRSADTDEILSELGFDVDAIADLRASGAVS